MAVVEELLRSEADGKVSFGNHMLAQKAKVEDYSQGEDLQCYYQAGEKRNVSL